MVTNTAGEGDGSFAQAIADANDAGGGEIDFDIAGGGSQVISTAGCVATAVVFINGASQPNPNNVSGPLIELQAETSGGVGLELSQGAGGSEVAGLYVTGFATGIQVDSADNTIGGTTSTASNVLSGNGVGVAIVGPDATGNLVEGNLIGTDASGTVAQGNSSFGVQIASGASENTIGGSGAGERNVISGNGNSGVMIQDAGTTANVILGDFIGTDASGTSALGNAVFGVANYGAPGNTIGGMAAGDGNIISGNGSYNVLLDGAGTVDNLVAGNFVGTDSAGTSPVANPGDAFFITAGASYNTIGGTTASSRNIISNSYYGVEIYGPGESGNLIEGNYIGTDATGTVAMGSGVGVLIGGGAQGNLVGGTSPGAGNLISGNTDAEVVIQDVETTGNVVQGNLIGTDPTGASALSNAGFGVEIYGAPGNTVGGPSAGAGNVIAAPGGYGIYLQGTSATGNLVQGNRVGTDATGELSLAGPSGYGVGVNGAPGNTIGGSSPGDGNIIEAGSIDVNITGAGASGNEVVGNRIGTDASGSHALTGISAYGVVISGAASANTVGGSAVGAGNLISGNTAGVAMWGPVTGGNVVEGNEIGTDTTGTKALANGVGIIIADAAVNNVIGGTTPGAGNLVSGNSGTGVQIQDAGTTGNLVEGNLIGTDASGTSPVGNTQYGVAVYSAVGNTIGGTDSGAGNVISGNGYYGILLFGAGTSDNLVAGNLIGTDKSGTSLLSNPYNGVYIADAASDNTIGGTTPSARNVIAGANYGVEVYGSGVTGNLVEGNYIGTDATGTIAMANDVGVLVGGGGQNTLVGGSSPGAANLISGNGSYGVVIQDAGSTGNRVEGNLIGTDASGLGSLGNAWYGIGVFNAASDNTIGGTTEATRNVIAYSGTAGLYIGGNVNDEATGNSVLGNSIYANTNQGIDLANDGVTPNSPGGPHTGPNDLQNAPVLSSAASNGATTNIQGTLNGASSTIFRVEFFASPLADPSGYGEGETFLGFAIVTTDSNGNANFTAVVAAPPLGSRTISATATDPEGNTSEFSQAITVHSVPADLNDSYAIVHGRALTTDAFTGVLANDADVLGAPLSASVVTSTQHGDLDLNADGSFTYTPEAGFAGTDTFTYQATDGPLAGNVATVTIAVTDTAPSAANDAYTVANGQTLTVDPTQGVLASDTDAEGDPLTATRVADVQHGDLTLNADGSFTYTPDTGFVGTDSFSYEASDGILTCPVATVTIAVTEDTAVTAANDAYTVVHGHTLTIGAGSGVLANDTDTSGDPLSAILVSGPQDTSVTLNADGSFTYTPPAGFVGTDSFTYQASDGTQTSDVATVAIAVTDSAPVAANDAYTAIHDQTLTVDAAQGVLANDLDGDGDSLTASVVSDPRNGTVALNPDGSFSYTPAAHFSGTDSFTYQVSDGILPSNIATVTIAVAETAPVAVPDAYTTGRDLPLVVSAVPFGPSGVLVNDTDAEGDPLTASLVSGPAHGDLTLSADGTFAYSPATGFVGIDEFTYEASDGAASDGQLSSVATVTIDVTETAPIAADDSFTTPHDQPLTLAASSFGASGVLFNDANFSGDPLTASLVTGARHGAVALNPDGTFTYTPADGFTGTDTFTYVASDGLDTSNVATVTIDVTESAPTAAAHTYAAKPGQPLTVPAGSLLAAATDADGDALTASLVSQAQDGNVSVNPDGSFTYTPGTGFSGTDTFTYQVSDGLLASAAATVTITVTETAPVAVADPYAGLPGQTLDPPTSVLGNDTDAENDPLTALLVTGPADGQLTLNPDGTFTYEPNGGFSGTDSFTYEASDGLLTSNIATVTITVADVAPVAVADTYSASPGHTLAESASDGVLANDADSVGNTITATVVTTTADGTLALNPDGSFTYSPDSGFSGTDSFSYEATDGTLASAPVTVTITVVDQAPVANDDSYSVAQGQTLVTPMGEGVLANDEDLDGDRLTAQLVSDVSDGKLTLEPSGLFSYTPDPGFSGSDSFTYQASDGTLTSELATVTIDVTAPTSASSSIISTTGPLAPGLVPLAPSAFTQATVGTGSAGANTNDTFSSGDGFAGLDSLAPSGSSIAESVGAGFHGVGSIASGSPSGNLIPFEPVSELWAGQSGVQDKPPVSPLDLPGFIRSQVTAILYEQGYQDWAPLVTIEGIWDGGPPLPPGNWSYNDSVTRDYPQEEITSTVDSTSVVSQNGEELSGNTHGAVTLRVRIVSDSTSANNMGTLRIHTVTDTWVALSWQGQYSSDYGTEYPFYAGTCSEVVTYSGGATTTTAESQITTTADGSTSFTMVSTASDLYSDSSTTSGKGSNNAVSGALSTTGSGSESESCFYDGAASVWTSSRGSDGFGSKTSDSTAADNSFDSGSEAYTRTTRSTLSFGEKYNASQTGMSTQVFGDQGLESSSGSGSAAVSIGSSDFGSDTASFMDMGYDTFGNTVSDASNSETAMDTGSEDFVERIASNDQYGDSSSGAGFESVAGAPGAVNPGWNTANVPSSSRRTDSGSVTGSFGVQGAVNCEDMTSDASSDETEAFSDSEKYVQGASSSVSFGDTATSKGQDVSGTKPTSTVSHADSGSDSSFFLDQGTDSNTAMTLGGQKDTTSSGSSDKEVSADQFSDQSSAIQSKVTVGATVFTTSTDQSSNSDSASTSSRGTDTSSSSTSDGETDPSTSSYNDQETSTEQDTEQDGTSLTVSPSTTYSTTTESDSGWDSATTTHTENDSDSPTFSDGETDSPSSSITDTETTGEQYSDQSSSLQSLNGSVTFTSSSTSDSDTQSDWSTDKETDSDTGVTAEGMATGSGESTTDTASSTYHSSDQTNAQATTTAGSTSATTSTSSSDCGSDYDSLTDNGSDTTSGSPTDGETDWASDSYSDTDTSHDHYTDHSSTYETSADGTLSATTSTTSTDSGSDTSSHHGQGSDSLSTPSDSLSDNNTEDDNSVDHYSDQDWTSFTEQDGDANGTNSESSSDSETDSASSTNSGTSTTDVPTASGSESVSDTFGGWETSSETLTDYGTDVVTETDGVPTEALTENEGETGTDTSSESIQGTEWFTGIVASGTSYDGSDNFTDNDSHSLSSGLTDSSNMSRDATGLLTGTNFTSEGESEWWNDNRQDTEDMGVGDTSSDLVSLTSQDGGTKTFHGTDTTVGPAGLGNVQEGSTLQTNETATLTETGSSSYGATTSDDSTLTTAANGPSGTPDTQTLTGSPVTTQTGTDDPEDVAAVEAATGDFGYTGDIPSTPTTNPPSGMFFASPQVLLAVNAVGMVDPTIYGSSSQPDAAVSEQTAALSAEDYLALVSVSKSFTENDWLQILEATNPYPNRSWWGFGPRTSDDLETTLDKILSRPNLSAAMLPNAEGQDFQARMKTVKDLLKQQFLPFALEITVEVGGVFFGPEDAVFWALAKAKKFTVGLKGTKRLLLGPGGKALSPDQTADFLKTLERKGGLPKNPPKITTPLSGWKSTQTGITNKNSRILRKNLGLKPGSMLDAHHIVESTGKRAQPARDILDEYQIDINDAVNGVPLKPRGSRPAHHGNGIHSYAAIDEVNTRLKDAVYGVKDWAKARQRVLDALADLEREILDGTFP